MRKLAVKRRAAAVVGLLAAGAALGTGELVAGLGTRLPSLVVAVASSVRDVAPHWFVDFGIRTFGHNDKRALIVGTLVLAAVAGIAVGLLAARWRRLSVGVLAGFGVLGGLAAAHQAGASGWQSALSAGLAVSAGAITLVGLLRLAESSPARDARPADERHVGTALDRRRFVAAVGGVAALAALATTAGRLLVRGGRAAAARARVILPRPAQPAPPIPSSASFVGIRGLSAFVTPNRRFYRIDTALVVPDIDLASWRLRVKGQVRRPITLSYAQLLRLPMVERDITLACVSNPVGGPLLGTARWLGVPVSALLEEAGVQASATQLVGRSVDGFTAGFPTAVAGDGRSALVAVGMNAEPLPIEHGFPARLVVAGLYGYESATKWLSELELTTKRAFTDYWSHRGWAKNVAIKTQSRIDVPGPYALVRAGTVLVAGLAWAPTRGISRVEVQVDEGPWEDAELASALGPETWRQWRWQWAATPGSHVLSVRATDGSGHLQDSGDQPPFPSGATGYDSVAVAVRRQ